MTRYGYLDMEETYSDVANWFVKATCINCGKEFELPRESAHLEQDGSFTADCLCSELDEIHLFAKKLGLRREWFHVDHYDITQQKLPLAISLGAKQVTSDFLVKIRKQKRFTA